MKLSIIYNVCNYSDNLAKSLETISKINGNDFEVIFIFNISHNRIIKDVLSKIKLDNIKISYALLYQNLGHSYAYNLGLKLALGEYVYFAGSKNLFTNDFLDKINKLTFEDTFDLIITSDGDEVKFTKENYIKNKNTDLMSIKRKIFNKNFLDENKIFFTNYKYFNSIYLFEVNEKVKKIGYIESKICEFIPKGKVNYNLYDILVASEILFKKVANSNFDEDKKEYYYMTITISILYDFIYKIFKNHDDVNIQENSISNAIKLIEKIYPDFMTNKYLLMNIGKEIPDFIINFKPNIKYCKKVLAFL